MRDEDGNVVSEIADEAYGGCAFVGELDVPRGAGSSGLTPLDGGLGRQRLIRGSGPIPMLSVLAHQQMLFYSHHSCMQELEEVHILDGDDNLQLAESSCSKMTLP